MKKKLAIVLVLIVAVIVVVVLLNKNNDKQEEKKPFGVVLESEPTIIETNNEATGDLTGTKYTENGNNKIALAVNSSVKLTDVEITKTGDTSSLRGSDAYGQNSGILVGNKANSVIKNSVVITKGKGSSGIVGTDIETTVEIEDTEVETTGERSRGILATNGANIKAENTKVTTNGYKSTGIATDLRNGKIEINSCEVETNGEDSATVYSVGDITVKDSKLTANNAEAVVIDGNNKVTLENVTAVAAKKRGVVIYFTGPKVEGYTKGEITITGGSLTVKEGPAFYVTNAEGIINLKSTSIKTTSNILLQAKIDTEGELSQERKLENPQGGTVTLNAEMQELTGAIKIDKDSTLEMNLQNSSIYKGQINGENTAKEIKLTIDATSKWSLTGDSYVTDLNITDLNNIETNGYNIYCKGSNQIQSGEITLPGNGKLIII